MAINEVNKHYNGKHIPAHTNGLINYIETGAIDLPIEHQKELKQNIFYDQEEHLLELERLHYHKQQLLALKNGMHITGGR